MTKELLQQVERYAKLEKDIGPLAGFDAIAEPEVVSITRGPVPGMPGWEKWQYDVFDPKN